MELTDLGAAVVVGLWVLFLEGVSRLLEWRRRRRQQGQANVKEIVHDPALRL